MLSLMYLLKHDELSISLAFVISYTRFNNLRLVFISFLVFLNFTSSTSSRLQMTISVQSCTLHPISLTTNIFANTFALCHTFPLTVVNQQHTCFISFWSLHSWPTISLPYTIIAYTQASYQFFTLVFSY